MLRLIEDYAGSILDFARMHEYLGLHYSAEHEGWWYREWAPGAHRLYLTGDFNGWNRYSHPMYLNQDRIWEIFLPDAEYAERFTHHSLYKVVVESTLGMHDRIPACVRRVVQDDTTKDFAAQVWRPAQPYKWQHKSPIEKGPVQDLLIYEAHVGMATEEEKVGSYWEFKEYMLPRIKEAGYNAIQLMAIQEHPYYGSYGYHVSSLYAPSSRFGTPEELKELIDTAHGMGLVVIMDIVHSHAVKNFMEGLNQFDGTDHQYFHAGAAGYHELWDSKLYNYSKTEVLQFLLSNVRYWLEEFQFDGYRFDGVTSMLYHHHGNGEGFGNLDHYFGPGTNHDAVLYLTLANTLVHQLRPNAITVAEDVSGMPGIGTAPEYGGLGFDYRLAMGIPDHWIKLIKEKRDEDWDLDDIWWALTNRPEHEKVVGYAESHDQALVGDQTIAFRLMGPSMYTDMATHIPSMVVDRGMALHKIIRLLTLSLGGEGYLNFMGNEWGHPEWIDFPRVGNNWSYLYARRQWSLAQSDWLRYKFLGAWDHAMTRLATEYHLLGGAKPTLISVDRERQIMSYTKGPILFVVSLHPSHSSSDYAVPAPHGVAHKLILSSDDAAFGGFERQPGGGTYFPNAEGELMLYVPNRTMLVYVAQPAAEEKAPVKAAKAKATQTAKTAEPTAAAPAKKKRTTKA